MGCNPVDAAADLGRALDIRLRMLGIDPKKRRQVNSQTWVWVVAILFFVVTMLIQCGVFRGGEAGDQVGAVWRAGFRTLQDML